jgi:hypothetical protein
MHNFWEAVYLMNTNKRIFCVCPVNIILNQYIKSTPEYVIFLWNINLVVFKVLHESFYSEEEGVFHNCTVRFLVLLMATVKWF